MTTIKAEDVRIPPAARKAVADRDEVVVMNRDRPVYAIVHPDALEQTTPSARGRSAREAFALLTRGPRADPSFAEAMNDVLGTAGPLPEAPWEHS